MTTNYFNKGILLAGGTGSRLYPLTRVVNKHLLPVYDKPMIYYPLSTLMLAGVREILLITTPRDVATFEALLGDGSQLGISLRYAVQPRPEGIAQALVIGRSFVGSDLVVLILGDNLFLDPSFQNILARASSRPTGATAFAYPVEDAQRYGVIELDERQQPVSLVEKPAQPKSNLALTGLYFYDSQAADIAASLEPSVRGELEITDVNHRYLEQRQLHVEPFTSGFAWFDAGTHESLAESAAFVQTLETRQGLKIGCIEETAWRKGYIAANGLAHLAGQMPNDHGAYLRRLLDEP